MCVHRYSIHLDNNNMYIQRCAKTSYQQRLLHSLYRLHIHNYKYSLYPYNQLQISSLTPAGFHFTYQTTTIYAQTSSLYRQLKCIDIGITISRVNKHVLLTQQATTICTHLIHSDTYYVQTEIQFNHIDTCKVYIEILSTYITTL